MADPRSQRLHTLALSLVLLAGLGVGCKSGQTGALLSIRSQVSVDSLTIIVRDIHYNTASTTHALSGRDLTQGPIDLLIEPSTITQKQFFVHVKGFKNGAYVAMDANILTIVSGTPQTTAFNLYTGFLDNDDDGFVQCLNTECDCDDTNPHTNPFTVKDCNNLTNYNCAGLPPSIGCACDGNATVACTNLPYNLINLAGVGACYFGTLTCTNGVLPSDCQAGTFVPEIAANYIDDNCDGTVDEGSPCGPVGTQRACHLGFVDDPNNPDASKRNAATALALGVCQDPNTHGPYGKQSCAAGGVWGTCMGDVLPQRDLVNVAGWAELAGNPAAGVVGQCDGLDNDCDGKVDNEPYFDNDNDSYTYCGTCVQSPNTPQVCAAQVDCNDDNASIHPGAHEICGNAIDEDCRCDHDPLGRPVSNPNSLIGTPSISPTLVDLCPATDAYLTCNVIPRSDPDPTGHCTDGNAYYGGYATSASGVVGCYLCAKDFGYNCNVATGTCTTQVEDCSACTTNSNTAATLVATRPFCEGPVSGTCNDLTGPQWTALTNSNPYGDCTAVSCAGYYVGITNGQCFAHADVSGNNATCSAGACQGAAVLCPNSPQAASPVANSANPNCTYVTSGCSGSTAPTFSFQASGIDMFNECEGAFTCSNIMGGVGPFYWGTTANGNNAMTCFFNADVTATKCNGQGQCQTRIQSCEASGKGAATPRTTCMQLTGGCSGTNPPTYGPVAANTDPYGDCGTSTCNGAGACFNGSGLGMACTSQSQCGSYTCVDGVCCSTACTGTCMACNHAATGGSDGTCAAIASQTTDPGTCTGSTGCTGSNCTCHAGSGVCQQGPGDTCTADTGCASSFCECTNAACSQRQCFGSSCLCHYVSGAACNGNVTNGTIVSGECDTTTNSECYNGSCLYTDGSACSSDNQCVNVCINSICDPPSAPGGPCTVGSTTNCQGSAVCQGGVCVQANGAACTADNQCSTSNCECASAACSSRICNNVACLCQIPTPSYAGCSGNVNASVTYQNCTGMQACDGAGSCKTVNGQGCSSASSCISGICDCDYNDSACNTHQCSSVSCPCTSLNSAGTACGVSLVAGTQTPACGNPNACNAAGACKTANGHACTVSAGCATGFCECTDAPCTASAQVCNSGDCGCTLSNAAGTACSGGNVGQGNITLECSGTHSCNGAGACTSVTNQSCTTNANCTSAHCGCTNSGCSTSVCTTAACGCKLSSSSGTACNGGNVTRLSTTPDCNASTSQACDGAGNCKSATGVSCTAGSQCASGTCTSNACT